MLRPPTPVALDVLLRERELSTVLGVDRRTLHRWRIAGFGPTWVRVGRLIRYPRADLERWIAERTVTPRWG